MVRFFVLFFVPFFILRSLFFVLPCEPLRLDALLFLMVLIWGSNFSAIKYALRDFSQIPFNAMRLLLASAVFLAAIVVVRRRAALGCDRRNRH